MTITREIIMELRVPLSGELRRDARIIISVGEFEDSLKASAREMFGDNFTVNVETVTKRPGAGRKKAIAAEESVSAEEWERQQTVAEQASEWLNADDSASVAEAAPEAEAASRRGRHRNSGSEHAEA